MQQERNPRERQLSWVANQNHTHYRSTAMAINSIPERSNTYDNQKPNRLTKSILIKKWLVDFAKQKHKLHYSDNFCFSSLLTAVEGGSQ